MLTPVVLGTFSAIELDMFYMFGSALVVFSIFSARLGDVFVRMLSYAHSGATNLAPRAKSEKAQAKCLDEPNWSLFSQAYRTLGSLLLIAAVPSLLFAFFSFAYAIGSLTDWTFSDKWLVWAAIVGALNSTIDITFLRYQSAMLATGNMAKSNLVQVASSVASIIFSAAVILFGGGLFGLLLTQFVFNWVRRIVLIKLLPEIIRKDSWKLAWEKKIVSWAWSPLWKSLVSMTAGMGVERSVGLFLVSVGQPGFAAPFLMAQSFLGTVSQLGSVPLQSQLPRFASMLALGHGRAVVVQALARIIPQPITIISFVLIGGLLIPAGLELIGSEVSFLSYSNWLILGFGLALRRFLSSFAQVYVLTNNMVFYIRTVIAGIFSIVFFYFGAKEMNYLYFSLGLWVPSALMIGSFSVKKFMELADGEEDGCWKEGLDEMKILLRKLNPVKPLLAK